MDDKDRLFEEKEKASSLGALERLFFRRGRDAGSIAFRKSFPLKPNKFYVHIRHGQGKAVTRTDAAGIQTVNYWGFDPPGFWQNPYQLMRVLVHDERKELFLFHDGEEIVIPIAGPGVHYDFFWTEDGLGLLPGTYPSTGPILVGKGEAIRIQPQIPHRAWGASGNSTEAWMITRPVAGAAAQIYLHAIDGEQSQPNSRQATAADLSKPGHYALRAWGISEMIRLRRMQSNLRVTQVAEACEIDPAQLSKIEGGSTNVNMEVLARLCTFLEIDLTELIAPTSQPYSIQRFLGSDLEKEEGNSSPIFKRPPTSVPFVKTMGKAAPDHFVHPVFWRMSKNRPLIEQEIQRNQDPTTWIMLEGRAVADIAFPTDSLNPTAEVLDPESVLHLRGGHEVTLSKLLPLEDCSLLQIVYSSKCVCAPSANED